MIGKLSNETLLQMVCDCFMELLDVNSNVDAASTNEQVIKCILTVDEFESSITKLIENMENNITTLWRDNAFFKRAYDFSFLLKFLWNWKKKIYHFVHMQLSDAIIFIFDHPMYRSHVEELLLKLLCDGPVARPQQYSTWYRLKKSYLRRELQAVCELTAKKRDECSQYIKRWVCIRFWIITVVNVVHKTIIFFFSAFSSRMTSIGDTNKCFGYGFWRSRKKSSNH